MIELIFKCLYWKLISFKLCTCLKLYQILNEYESEQLHQIKILFYTRDIMLETLSKFEQTKI